MEMTGGFLGVDRELGPIGSTLLRAATAGDSCLPSDSSALATRSIWDSSPDRSEVSQYAIRQPQTPLSSCRIDLYSGSRTSAADLDICNEVQHLRCGPFSLLHCAWQLRFAGAPEGLCGKGRQESPDGRQHSSTAAQDGRNHAAHRLVEAAELELFTLVHNLRVYAVHTAGAAGFPSCSLMAQTAYSSRSNSQKATAPWSQAGYLEVQ